MFYKHFLYEHENSIKFRQLDKIDLEDLINLKNESWHNTHRISILNNFNQEKWFEDINNNDSNTPRNVILVAACYIDDNWTYNIGIFKIMQICWQSRLAMVGWDVYKDHRNKGFGKKLVKAGVDFCFKVLNLHRLQADILKNNQPSQKCATNAGFKLEGYQKKVIFREGEWIDNMIFGIISPEK